MTAPYPGGPQGPWPPPPPYGPPVPVQPATRRRSGWVLAAVVVVVVAVAGGATAFVVYTQLKDSEPRKIEALINNFSAAVSSGNPQTIASFMCAEEAAPFLDFVEDPGTEAPIADQRPFEIGEITVRGDAASAVLKFPGSESQTMYFRKEDGEWTVCAPAKAQM
jgi:hypothetical protein